MSKGRADLLQMLENQYLSRGWRVQRRDGTVEATGPGGVTWIGRAVVAEDLESEDFAGELSNLAQRRMPGGGELCPLELIPAADCAGDLQELIDRLGLGRRPHVSIYSLAAAA